MPPRLACPRPHDLVAGALLIQRHGRGRWCGCGVGWVSFAFTGSPRVGLLSHPHALRFALDVWRLAGISLFFTSSRRPGWEYEVDLTTTFDVAYEEDAEFALRFCYAWRLTAERAGYDTSGLTPLPPISEALEA